jgi:hypothetical protein
VATLVSLAPSLSPPLQVFPRERPGLNYDLNWSLADDDVTPKGDAFRNASAKELLTFVKGKVNRKANTATRDFAAPASKKLATEAAPGFSAIDLDAFDEKYQQVWRALRPLC